MNVHHYDQRREIRCKGAYIEGVGDRILYDAGKNIQVNQDMFHMVVYVGLHREMNMGVIT